MLAWAPGVRLDVDVLGARVEGEGTLLGEPLGDVDELAAAVVALAGQALGVLVGQPRALGLHDRGGDVVLAGDQLDLVVLAAALAEHRLPEDGIELGDRLEREARRWRDRHGVADSFLPLRLPIPAPPARPAVSSHERGRRRDSWQAPARGRSPMSQDSLDDEAAGALDTPAVVVDLDRMDARIASMAAAHARARHRPAAAREDAQEHRGRAAPDRRRAPWA